MSSSPSASRPDEPRVSDVVQPTGPLSCGPFDPLLAAAARLVDADLEALPVLAHDGSGRPIGWLTSRGFARAAARDPEALARLEVRSALSPAPCICRLWDPLRDVLEEMRRASTERLPVVDGEGRLCGVVTLEAIAARVAASDVRQPTALQRAICETLAAQGGEGPCEASTSKT